MLLIHVTDTYLAVTRKGNHYCSMFAIKMDRAVFEYKDQYEVKFCVHVVRNELLK